MRRAAGALLLGALAAGCAPERPCGAQLWYVDNGAADDVVAVGDWNGWDPSADPLEQLEPGVWAAALDLPPGDYAYQLRVDGVPQNDLQQPLLTVDPQTGAERSLLRVAGCAAPLLRPLRGAVNEDGVGEATLEFLRGDGGPRLDAAAVDVAVWDPSAGAFGPAPAGLIADPEADPATGALRVALRGLPPGKTRLRVRAADRAGATATATLELWSEPPWTTSGASFSHEDQLIYQVMIDRFAAAAGPVHPEALQPGEIGARLGGDLAGVRRMLDAGWFSALGVTTLWLSPVQPNPDGAWPTAAGHLMEGYHGYWPTAPGGVEPAIGDEAELRALVAAAHQAGLRVLLDVIPNHVHEEHPWRQAHAGTGWFHEEQGCICGSAACPWAEAMEACWFADYLPDLDWSHPPARKAAVASIVALRAAYDLDGLRIDAVPMIPRAGVRELVAALRPETAWPAPFLLGETFTGPGEHGPIRRNIGPHGLDGQFDFPLMWALRGFAAWGSLDAAGLERALADSAAAWAGAGATMSPFVGNHDVSRFLSEAAGHRTDAPWTDPPAQPEDDAPYAALVLAQALALTLPGAPVLWQGDELGLAGATDPDCRRPLPDPAALTAQQAWVLDRVRRIGRARRCLDALRRGARLPLAAEGQVIAYLRDAEDGAPALIVANAGAAATRLQLQLPADLAADPDTWHRDIIEGRDLVVLGPGATLTLTVPGRSARLFVPATGTCAESP